MLKAHSRVFAKDPSHIYKCNGILASLQIIARHQTATIAVLAAYLSLPPSTILVSQYCENISLRESKLFRDLSLIHIHCPSCKSLLVGIVHLKI